MPAKATPRTPRLRAPLGVRINRYMPEPGPPDACWDWKGAVSKGYPVIGVRVGPPGKRVTRYRYVARLIYAELFGPIPAYLCLCHRCNNPRCMNPAHWYVATHGQNMRDAARDGLILGNRNKGERHNLHKLTDAHVREIRRRWAAGGIRQQDLAAEYGVRQGTISFVVTGQTWKHLL